MRQAGGGGVMSGAASGVVVAREEHIGPPTAKANLEKSPHPIKLLILACLIRQVYTEEGF